MQIMQTAESGVVMFKTDTLQFRLMLNTSIVPSLNLKATPAPGTYQAYVVIHNRQILLHILLALNIMLSLPTPLGGYIIFNSPKHRVKL